MAESPTIQVDTVNGQAAHIIHNHGPVYFVCTLPAEQSPQPMTRPERRAKTRPSPKSDQSQVLALMDQLLDRIAVLDFMEREFDTRMVVELDSRELFRLRRYVEVILAGQGGK
jgi:hypothetical protein